MKTNNFDNSKKYITPTIVFVKIENCAILAGSNEITGGEGDGGGEHDASSKSTGLLDWDL